MKNPKAGAGNCCLQPASTLLSATSVNAAGQGRASGSRSLCHTDLSSILGGLSPHTDNPSHFVLSLFHDLLSPPLSAPPRPHIAHALDLIIHKLKFKDSTLHPRDSLPLFPEPTTLLVHYDLHSTEPTVFSLSFTSGSSHCSLPRLDLWSIFLFFL